MAERLTGEELEDAGLTRYRGKLISGEAILAYGLVHIDKEIDSTKEKQNA